MKRSAAFAVAGLVVVLGGLVALVTSYSLAQSWVNGPVSATYVHGVLHVNVPYEAPHSGDGNLTVEVLDPEDRVVGGVQRDVSVQAGRGFGPQDLAIDHAMPVGDLVWHRLRYRFAYRGEQAAALDGIVSISRVLRRPVVHVLDQQQYLSGSEAAVRVVVTEANSAAPVTAGSLRIALGTPGAKEQNLYTGSLNERGTTRADFRFPAQLAGKFALQYHVDTTLGETDFTQDIRLEEKASILLTTEKPVYQPGQTIHVRALALDQADHHATGARAMTFEVDDSRGNKVFRKTTQTDEYGVASAEFALADEVNLGTYHLRALMDGQQDKSEIALEVQKYVLPRFKVDLDLAGKAAKAKRGYRPGDHVTGTVRSNYFFGKPVDHADVVVKAMGRDVQSFDAGQAKGTTDAEGAFRFDIRLPEFFAGHPLNQGAALVTIEATVKDNAGHSETHGDAVSVSESPLLITAVPEGGALTPGLPNQLYVLASYPDGTPAKAQILVHTDSGDETAKTDAGGVANVQITGPQRATNIRIEAKDIEGNSASVPLAIASKPGADQIMLHADKALYRAGERIAMQVRSTKARGSAYVDVVKDGQTIATHDIDIVHGRAELNLTATPAMAGTVRFQAYLFGRDGSPVSDRRLAFVQPADELKIETTVDAAVYKPGGEAQVGFRVTNGRGEGVQAALGLEVVDQAVFALAEKQPGFAKVFFYLEQEAMKPRYEIHSVGLPETISRAIPAESQQRDRAARALFAAMEVTPVNDSVHDYGRDVPRERFPVYAGRYRKRMSEPVNRLIAALEQAEERGQAPCGRAVLDRSVDEAKAIDAWGNRMRIDQVLPNAPFLMLRSAGPDGQFYNSDDITVNFADGLCPASTSGVFRISRRHGAANGTAEVTGTVRDPTAGVVPNATVVLRDIESGTQLNAVADRSGKFRLANLRSGDYWIEVVSMGFKKNIARMPLRDGDRIDVDVMLELGASTETITINDEAPFLKTATGEISHTISVDRVSALPILAPAAPPPQPFGNVRVVAGAAVQPAPAAETHVRTWFPESLYVTPEIITDRDGRASITIPIADNITTWRMAMLASTKQGALGSGTSSIKVFQDFFTEMDLPVTLTQGDEVSIPVAVYNYAGRRGNVRLRLDESDWFGMENDSAEKTVAVDSDRVGASQFSIAAKRIGKFKLTLRAEMDGTPKRADIVVREIEVVPNGREQSMVFNGRLDSVVKQTVDFPQSAIPESGTVFVRLYPGPLSQVVEGMDSLLRMPFGCFEQTSSSTYPNVLALGYMKRTKKATPEISAKAEGYIAAGYQRLLTFEVQGGGFSWFGNAPANKILTSYGLMEFSDMAKVHDVDEHVIQRTQQWLASRQLADGSWGPDTQFINEGATNRYNSDALRITAYVAWSLEATGYRGTAVDRAKRFIEEHSSARGNADAYTLAVVANFAADYAKDPVFTADAMRRLIDARTEEGDQAWWKAEQTSMFATGNSASVETTGLAAQALMKDGNDSAVAAKAMNYIVAKKDAADTWGSTQATIISLRALLLSAEKSGAAAKGVVEVLLNGKVAGHESLTAANSDLFHQLAFKDVDARAANAVEIRFTGEGSMAYQVAGRYFVPWSAEPAHEPLSIEVNYDRTRLMQDQIATATATVKNNLGTTANMVMVDLGIPPGFELLSEDLDAYRDNSAGRTSGRLEKYSLTPTQAILYFDSIAPRGEFALRFRLRAKYPIRARSFESRVYEYYAPDVNAVAQPVLLEVRK